MKKIKNNIVIIFLVYILLQIIINVNEIHEIILFSYNIFKENIIPNLLPFLIISKLLINYGFIDMCYNIFNPITKKLFKINGNASFIFIMSMLTGFPSSSKYTKDLYLNNRITLNTASKVLMFTHFSNPLFIIGTISNFINYNVALIILLAHYLGNIIIGLIFRNYNIDITNNKSIKTNPTSFGLCLLNGIRDSIDTLFVIYGTMTFFLIISNKYTSMLNISNKYKALLMGTFISFGGLSVHTQILSIISDTDIKYAPFLIARIIHAIITCLIIYIIL